MDPTEQDVDREVLDVFRQFAQLPGDSVADQLSVEYLDDGILDSMAVVELVVALEDRFDVFFDPDDLESTEFRTAGGIGRIVSRLRTP